MERSAECGGDEGVAGFGRAGGMTPREAFERMGGEGGGGGGEEGGS